jgi:hypothetical protein
VSRDSAQIGEGRDSAVVHGCNASPLARDGRFMLPLIKTLIAS